MLCSGVSCVLVFEVDFDSLGLFLDAVQCIDSGYGQGDFVERRSSSRNALLEVDDE